MSAYLKTTYAIPDTAATGSRDSITAVLTAAPGFTDTSFGEVYCLSGTVGIAEGRSTPPASRITSGPTIIRGVLFLQEPRVGSRESRGELLDASGRRVLDLKPGANDVSRLAPGVYFVHSTLANRQSSIAKVIVAR